MNILEMNARQSFLNTTMYTKIKSTFYSISLNCIAFCLE